MKAVSPPRTGLCPASSAACQRDSGLSNHLPAGLRHGSPRHGHMRPSSSSLNRHRMQAGNRGPGRTDSEIGSLLESGEMGVSPKAGGQPSAGAATGIRPELVAVSIGGWVIFDHKGAALASMLPCLVMQEVLEWGPNAGRVAHPTPNHPHPTRSPQYTWYRVYLASPASQYSSTSRTTWAWTPQPWPSTPVSATSHGCGVCSGRKWSSDCLQILREVPHPFPTPMTSLPSPPNR